MGITEITRSFIIPLSQSRRVSVTEHTLGLKMTWKDFRKGYRAEKRSYPPFSIMIDLLHVSSDNIFAQLYTSPVNFAVLSHYHKIKAYDILQIYY